MASYYDSAEAVAWAEASGEAWARLARVIYVAHGGQYPAPRRRFPPPDVRGGTGFPGGVWPRRRGSIPGPAAPHAALAQRTEQLPYSGAGPGFESLAPRRPPAARIPP